MIYGNKTKREWFCLNYSRNNCIIIKHMQKIDGHKILFTLFLLKKIYQQKKGFQKLESHWLTRYWRWYFANAMNILIPNSSMPTHLWKSQNGKALNQKRPEFVSLSFQSCGSWRNFNSYQLIRVTVVLILWFGWASLWN